VPTSAPLPASSSRRANRSSIRVSGAA
jgi:hypothetical protein